MSTQIPNITTWDDAAQIELTISQVDVIARQHGIPSDDADLAYFVTDNRNPDGTINAVAIYEWLGY